ncbi:hypothetical protein JOL79_18255 [Microbispora sp. RL4-1S]|uniref:Uncharacterized protein n=1 Tax=Microbispora oryzae TaxID=2806554 RepID=A0A941AK63_9ACTN|nr:hypothetical protein [Microbispora oryzae]MBP2705762.1 hypothetical protein [Microbispora oryzae]
MKLSKGIAPVLIACAAAGWMAIGAAPAQAAPASGTTAVHHPDHVYQPAFTGPDGYVPAWWAPRHRYVHRFVPVQRYPSYRHVRWIHGRYYYRTPTGWHCLHNWHRR